MHSERILSNIRLKENQQYSVEAGFRYPKLKKKKNAILRGVVVLLYTFAFMIF
jgi:hypothetical protein